ncbi:hypothetical protein M406DRAFT_348455 [Cryphonectria parasitica EP155]|uniref:C2H2-type domain-containing protein n=1 Tax=Cryphonectria parasitica (strain ATCC 38755 / EP155) TaxID=660469 RepID=A0A9P4XTR4_CRYP1|nr:uncharacterized protein M406DRAFT_348455 [Cryphonectria parasitica EP155]KAF3761169.1 hypothetical protein M406DRAFT_348455 [Cryphonectria parasitica EP155]
MSVAYDEPRSFHDDSPYAPVGEGDHDHDHADINKYINTEANVEDMADLAAVAYAPGDGPPSPFNTSDSAALDLGPVAPPNVDPANVPIRDSSPVLLSVTNVTHPPSSRSKPISKPNRVATKNRDGLFECSWEDCKEAAKTFQRRCEWSKHMDKHERPYVCTVKGCEKVQGFTYSGGLLRHEREVHGKHGGPKKALNCPHSSCKRNTGKGFSRTENLQEHLRRCHRLPSAGPSTAIPSPVQTVTMGSEADSNHKRKRADDDQGEGPPSSRERFLQEENDRLREENEDLRRQLQEATRNANDMRTQLQAMQATISVALSVSQPAV